MVGLLNDHEEMIQFFCFDNAFRFTTAVSLMCTFQILHLGKKPDEAYAPFARLSACFMGFTDASPLPLTHKMSVISYLRGFYKGYSMKWYNPQAFNLLDWEFYSRSENGDMNWVIPGRLLALASPWMQRELPDGYRVVVPSDLTKPFKERGITHIIRLNERLYDERVFTRAGFKHTEWFFNDGECPPYRVREAFLRLMNSKDVIAVHCKAGLGRTYVFARS
jgi:cell division cycle 14